MAMVAGLVALVMVTPGASATGGLPDLGMAQLSDIYLTTSSTGRKELRFSATVVNVGPGPLELAASRSDASSPFIVQQRIFGAEGSSTLPTNAELIWGGDGHLHWHITDLEAYELVRLDNGTKVGTSAKGGFCFYDDIRYRTSLPGAPASPIYVAGSVCGQNDKNTLALTMGLSVGWGDTYPWSMAGQYIDVTGLTSGNYRLIATADPNGHFSETSAGNNTTWAELKLQANRKGPIKISITRYGPSA